MLKPLRHTTRRLLGNNDSSVINQDKNQQNEFLRALHQITLDLLENRSRPELLNSIIMYAAALIEATYVQIMFREGDELVVHASNIPEDLQSQDHLDRKEVTLSWKAYEKQEVVTVNNYSTLPTRHHNYDQFSLTAVACFPIIANKTCLGVMNLGRIKHDNPFTPEQIQEGKLFAQLVATLIHNANLNEIAANESAHRKQSDVDLHRSQDRQRALLMAIPDLMFRISGDGTFLDFHTTRPDKLLVPPEQFLGKKMSQVLPLEMAELHARHIQNVLTHEREDIYEYQLTEGEQINYYECRMVRSGEDEVLSIIRNITEPKEMERRNRAFLKDMKALQEIFLELAQVNDLIPLYYHMVKLIRDRLNIDRVALFVIDPSTNELCGTFGVDSNGEIRNETYYREAITRKHWTLEILNSPKHALFWQNTLIFDNGIEIGVGWKTAAALWDGEKAIGYLVTDNYINQQPPRTYQDELTSLLGSTYGQLIRLKEAQISLQYQEQQQRALLNAIPDLMVRVNFEGQFLDYRPAKPDLLQMDIANVKGKYVSDLFPHKIAASQMQYIDSVLQTNDKAIYEYSMPMAGQTVNYEIRMVPNGSDEVLAIVRDITEHKKLEQQTFALALEKARGKVLTQFVQHASHEFRTPLSIINNAAYLMTIATETEKIEKYANTINTRVDQLSRLLDMILCMTKLDSDIKFNKEEFRLGDLINKLIHRVEKQSKQKHIALDLKVEPQQKLTGEVVWLQEALWQILDNAVRYTPDNGHISLKAYAQDANLVIVIADTGIGIADEALPHIFERFWRQDEAHSTPGFGLGLSIALKIVEMHEGRIEVESAPEKGSIFKVLLPI